MWEDLGLVFITSTMWRREMRGGQRQWWRMPWTVPAIVLVLVVIQELLFPLSEAQYHPDLLNLLSLWPELVLSAWITVMVTWSIARDSQPAQREMLAVTLIDHHSLLLAKTFGSTFPAMIVMGAHGVWQAFAIEGRLDPLLVTAQDPIVRATAGALAPLAILAQGFLIPTFIATLAARFGVSTRWLSLAAVISFIVAWVSILLLLRVAWIGWLVPPMAFGVLVIWIFILLNSHAIAAIAALGICVAGLKVGYPMMSSTVAITVFPLVFAATAVVVTMGLESGAGLFAMWLLGVFAGMGLAVRYLSDYQLHGQYTDIVLAFAITPWLLHWSAWSKRGLKTRLFASE